MADPRKLYVGNLHDAITKEDITQYLISLGATDVWVSDPVMFAFARFATEERAKDICTDYNGELWKGCRLKINFARLSHSGVQGCTTHKAGRGRGGGGRRFGRY